MVADRVLFHSTTLLCAYAKKCHGMKMDPTGHHTFIT